MDTENDVEKINNLVDINKPKLESLKRLILMNLWKDWSRKIEKTQITNI